MAEFGVGIRRLSPLAVDELDVSAHVRAILTTITGLAAHRAYDGMDRWLHTLGYRGHVTTKSRLFSTTMGALRAYRATWSRQHQTQQAATAQGRRNIVGWHRLLMRPNGNSIGSDCAVSASVP